METHKTSEYTKKFFDRLFALKEFVYQKANETNNADIKEIYERLHEIFKDKGEE